MEGGGDIFLFQERFFFIHETLSDFGQLTINLDMEDFLHLWFKYYASTLPEEGVGPNTHKEFHGSWQDSSHLAH